MSEKVCLVLALDNLLEEEDMEEYDEDIFPYFFAALIRRERVPSVRIFYEEVLPDFS